MFLHSQSKKQVSIFRLEAFFFKHKLIYDLQWGFIKGKSTGKHCGTLDKAKQTIEDKLITMGVFIDLTKAFNLTDHNLCYIK